MKIQVCCLSFLVGLLLDGCWGQDTSQITYLALEPGNVPGTGRVVIQMDFEPVNGSICDKSWTNNEALVVCKMLKYNSGVVAGANEFGEGSHNYLLSEPVCVGTELTLSKCMRAPIVNCSYTDAEVAVRCSSPDPAGALTVFSVSGSTYPRGTQPPPAALPAVDIPSQCSSGANNVRLHGVAGVPGMGFVQVLKDNKWQFVCDDKWSERDAKVVCRELCYNNNDTCCPRPAVETRYRPAVPATVDIAWDTVECTGSESSIFNCKHSLPNTRGCTSKDLAGVQCVITPEVVVPPQPIFDCTSYTGNMVLSFPLKDFPDITSSNVIIVNQPSCTASHIQLSSTSFNVTIPHSSCGSTAYKNGTNRCYENAVEYIYQISQGNLLLDFRRHVFDIKCCLPEDKNVSIKFVPKTISEYSSLLRYFDYDAEIHFYQNEMCDVVINDNPYSITVGNWVYVGVKVKAESESLFKDEELKLVLLGCSVNPIGGRSSLSYPEYPLIENKCPATLSTVTVYPISNTTQGFRFKAFKFFGYSTVYITCQLRVCQATDDKPYCDRTCIQSRRKRDAGHLTEVNTVISQTLNIRDLDEDSPSYDPDLEPVFSHVARKTKTRTIRSELDPNNNKQRLVFDWLLLLTLVGLVIARLI
ncbi:deleted in malignant brain tumors 1 protein-like [Physella acuta]|uniref:deleted in malignant brain tumors 1 protein-like n=1 Tax=Physella acuta TaxID=109671 RepID=UPI0027DE229B|nr:deleted in malignant brain tumors 1 protein-like [Physella acuta]